jgi:acetyltransferase-like isoleucine patch superfamily enzyme
MNKTIVRQLKLKDIGNNNQVLSENSFMIKTNIEINGINCLICIGPNTIIENCVITILGNYQKILIGEDCRIRNSSFWLEDGNNEIIIGNKTTIEGAHLAATEMYGRIQIGNDCMLSYDIDLRNGDSHVIIDLENNSRINYPDNIIIGNHVWIGAHSKILKGCQISDHCIIGTGTVLSMAKIPANTLTAGVPGKILKNNVTWERDRLKWKQSQKDSN